MLDSGRCVEYSGRCRQEPVYLSWKWCLYNDHRLGYRHDYSIFYQLPNSNLFTHRALYSWEKPLVNPTAPGSTFPSYCFPIYLFASLFSDLLNQKPKNILLHIYSFYLCSWEIYLSYLSLPNLSYHRREIDNLSFATGCKYLLFVCRCCLLGGGDPPTGSITLVS